MFRVPRERFTQFVFVDLVEDALHVTEAEALRLAIDSDAYGKQIFGSDGGGVIASRNASAQTNFFILYLPVCSDHEMTVGH